MNEIDVAAKLYRASGQEGAVANDGDAASKLYGDSALSRVVQEHVGTEGVVLGLSAEQREVRHAEFKRSIKDAGLSAGVAARLYELGTRADVASARGTGDAFDSRAALEDRRRELRDLYGLDEGAALFDRAMTFADKHDGLAGLLKHERIRLDRDVVHGLVEHVRQNDLGRK